MKFLDRFERLVERSVEGGLGRILPRSLQPVQIAKAAARAMDDGRVVGLRGPEVPNLYRIRLAPADLARFGEFRGTLAANTAAYLAEYARQRGLRPVSPPSVELVEDRSVPPGSVRVDARFRDLTRVAAKASCRRGGELGGCPSSSATRRRRGRAATPGRRRRGARRGASSAFDGTRPIAERRPRAFLAQEHPAQPTGASPVLDEHGWLVDRGGQRYPLRGREVVRLGRAADNDVVLDADTVSRHHAELRWQQGHWFAYDLGSTNGTTVAGAPLTTEPILLPAGATLRLGDRALIFVTS